MRLEECTGVKMHIVKKLKEIKFNISEDLFSFINKILVSVYEKYCDCHHYVARKRNEKK